MQVSCHAGFTAVVPLEAWLRTIAALLFDASAPNLRRNAGKLDHGVNVQASARCFFSRYVGVTGNFMFSQLGVTGHELNLLNEPERERLHLYLHCGFDYSRSLARRRERVCAGRWRLPHNTGGVASTRSQTGKKLPDQCLGGRKREGWFDRPNC